MSCVEEKNVIVVNEIICNILEMSNGLRFFF